MIWILVIEFICLMAIIFQDFKSHLISIWLIFALGIVVFSLSWSSFADKFWIPDLIPLAILALSSSFIFFRKKITPTGSADFILVALLCMRWSLDISILLFIVSGLAGLLVFFLSKSPNPKIPYGAWLSLMWISAEGVLFLDGMII
ncbi:MAG: hypothetical protein LCH54_17190 [Bacteroidetes bacterium]|nr:hypothetical protein [Bacteroidota bacterium]